MNYLPDWGFLCGWRCARISIGWMDLLICWIFFVFFIILFFFFLFSFFFWLPWMHVKGGTLWMKTNWKLMLEEEKRLQKDFSAGIVGFLFFFSEFRFLPLFNQLWFSSFNDEDFMNFFSFLGFFILFFLFQQFWFDFYSFFFFFSPSSSDGQYQEGDVHISKSGMSIMSPATPLKPEGGPIPVCPFF